MAKGSVLYDHKKEPAKKEEKKPAEKAKEEPKGETEPAKEAASEDKGGEGGEKNDVFERLGVMLKSHESERKDLNNNHREERRQMHARHEKALRDHFESMAANQAAGNAADGAAPAEPAGGEAKEA